MLGSAAGQRGATKGWPLPGPPAGPCVQARSAGGRPFPCSRLALVQRACKGGAAPARLGWEACSGWLAAAASRAAPAGQAGRRSTTSAPCLRCAGWRAAGAASYGRSGGSRRWAGGSWCRGARQADRGLAAPLMVRQLWACQLPRRASAEQMACREFGLQAMCRASADACGHGADCRAPAAWGCLGLATLGKPSVPAARRQSAAARHADARGPTLRAPSTGFPDPGSPRTRRPCCVRSAARGAGAGSQAPATALAELLRALQAGLDSGPPPAPAGASLDVRGLSYHPAGATQRCSWFATGCRPPCNAVALAAPHPSMRQPARPQPD